MIESAVARLRRETAAAHEAVDAAFGRFRLDDRADYARMLTAHARALLAAEAALAALPFARTLPPRTPLLAADLADLGVAMPEPLPWHATDEAALWGTLYVVEGSRLGGVMLARSVPDGWPNRYLAAAHAPGMWRTIRDAIDAAEVDADALVAGALACFDLYARAAAGLASPPPTASHVLQCPLVVESHTKVTLERCAIRGVPTNVGSGRTRSGLRRSRATFSTSVNV